MNGGKGIYVGGTLISAPTILNLGQTLIDEEDED
jgi:hypothetical protein